MCSFKQGRVFEFPQQIFFSETYTDKDFNSSVQFKKRTGFYADRNRGKHVDTSVYRETVEDDILFYVNKNFRARLWTRSVKTCSLTVEDKISYSLGALSYGPRTICFFPERFTIYV
jgi:hypothetical protein